MFNKASAMTAHKVFRRKLADEFSAHLVICTCCEVTINFPRTDMSEVYANVISIYHRRLLDQVQHPRQSNWSNQFIIETFSMFKTQDEWDEFLKLPQNSGQNLRKKTPADVGISVPYVTWAKAAWSKYSRMRSHIINVVNVDFKNLMTKGRPKSGIQTAEIVEQLRVRYFDEWCTTTAGVVTHLARPISEVPDWTPGAWWNSWIALGAPQGEKACAPLMSFESAGCTKEGDDELPKPLNDLLISTFQGRKDQRASEAQKKVAESAAAVIKHTPSSSRKPETTPIKTFEAHLKEREAMKNRLSELINFPGMPPSRVEEFKAELLTLMLKPIVTLETCGGAPSHRGFMSSATVTDEEFIVPKDLSKSFDFKAASVEAVLDDCMKAGAAQAAVSAPAAVQFGNSKLGEIHSKTTSFHRMVVPDRQSTPLFQKKKMSSDEAFSFAAQRSLHLDSGFDPEFWTTNEEYVILSLEDVLRQQPIFLEEFKTKFNVHFEDAEIQAQLSQCYAEDSLFFAFATLVNDRSRRDIDHNSSDEETVVSMRYSLFKHIQNHQGNIPGCAFNFEDDRSFVLDFHGDITEYLGDRSNRGGDPLCVHAFCHKFQFDVVLFSVKDPGGIIYSNSENVSHGNVDVCSILHDLNVGDVKGAYDTFYLAVPKCGAAAAEFSSSFLCEEEVNHGADIDAANEAMELAYHSLKKVRDDIAESDSNIKYRRYEVNRTIKAQNQDKLAAAQAEYDSALYAVQKLEGKAPLNALTRPQVTTTAGSAAASSSTFTPPVIVNSRPQASGVATSLQSVIATTAGSAAASSSTFTPPVIVRSRQIVVPVLDEFEEYHRLFSELPEWTIDLEIAFVSHEIGRGIRTLRKFLKGSCMGHYGGHRCDPEGNVVIRDPETDALFAQFANLNLDREMTGADFQVTHALCLGQTHLSGLVIDGYPLCDPSLDHVRDRRGAFAAANSAASASAANAKPNWVKSPHFKPDKINNLSDRVCFFTAKEDIE